MTRRDRFRRSLVGLNLLDAVAGFDHPPGCIGIADEVEQPAQEGKTVATPEAESRSVRRERLGKGPRRVVHSADRIRRDLGNRLRVLVLSQEIAGDAGWSRREQTTKLDPLARPQLPVVKADVCTPRLLPRWNSEVVTIGRQFADSIEGGGGPMGHDTLIGRPLPGRHVGCKLQPGRTEGDVVGRRCHCQAVDAVGNPLDEAFVAGQSVEGRSRNARTLGLATRHQPPLICGDGAEPTDGGGSSHYCNIPLY